MAILFKSSSSGNDHIISNLELNLVEEHFAKGFRKAQLVDLSASEDANVSFSDKFFDGKSDTHALIAKVAFENYSVFQQEQLPLIQAAITELQGLEEQCSGTFGILSEANETLLTQQVAIFEVDITHKQ
ncbi:hypothetical protein QX249_13260 [Vibrio parahaemolyticus]|uniref:Uncharacterized protein n=1 Tax=Vibrio parahaemolyticus TaxID=670 RepID=A0AAW8PZG5_VIBPH|nr:hypothetical protein [Vibrio parahaemolyticus]EGR2227600.1 hypothetical protein [Vibrio parahaemolyticus]MDS1821636.1 hypothetical protein [Vibrio parahaemolyticus]